MLHGKINYKWPFSIAMLVYQKVYTFRQPNITSRKKKKNIPLFWRYLSGLPCLMTGKYIPVISIIIPIVLDSLLLTFHIKYHHPTNTLHLAMITFRRPSKTPLSTRQLRGRVAVPINSTFQIPNARESHEMVSIYQLHQGMIAQPRSANQWLATGNNIHLNGERTICNKPYAWETYGDGDEEDYN